VRDYLGGATGDLSERLRIFSEDHPAGHTPRGLTPKSVVQVCAAPQGASEHAGFEPPFLHSFAHFFAIAGKFYWLWRLDAMRPDLARKLRVTHWHFWSRKASTAQSGQAFPRTMQ